VARDLALERKKRGFQKREEQKLKKKREEEKIAMGTKREHVSCGSEIDANQRGERDGGRGSTHNSLLSERTGSIRKSNLGGIEVVQDGANKKKLKRST